MPRLHLTYLWHQDRQSHTASTRSGLRPHMLPKLEQRGSTAEEVRPNVLYWELIQPCTCCLFLNIGGQNHGDEESDSDPGAPLSNCQRSASKSLHRQGALVRELFLSHRCRSASCLRQACIPLPRPLAPCLPFPRLELAGASMQPSLPAACLQISQHLMDRCTDNHSTPQSIPRAKRGVSADCLSLRCATVARQGSPP